MERELINFGKAVLDDGKQVEPGNLHKTFFKAPRDEVVA